MIRKTFNRIRGWFSSSYSIVEMLEDPINPRKENLYLIGEKDDPYFLIMLCPCGCLSVIKLSLLNDDSPNWIIFLDKKITLYPSIWRKIGCESHFWVKKGKIYWC